MPVWRAPATTSGWAECISSALAPPSITVASRWTRQETESGPNSPGSLAMRFTIRRSRLGRRLPSDRQIAGRLEPVEHLGVAAS